MSHGLIFNSVWDLLTFPIAIVALALEGLQAVYWVNGGLPKLFVRSHPPAAVISKKMV